MKEISILNNNKLNVANNFLMSDLKGASLDFRNIK
jgi:hypothetical protein